MKKLLVGFLLIILPQFAFAGITVETRSGIDSSWTINVDTSDWQVVFGDFLIDTLTITQTGFNYADADMVAIGNSVWSKSDKNPDPKTHYISGLDTVITRHRIECDTTTVEKLIINDTTVIRLSVECDTVYRVEYRPIWEPKIKVYLEPEQLKLLMWLIENSDQIEMKKTYGQKE